MLPLSIDYKDTQLLYGISKQQVVNELFSMKYGEARFYLVNLERKRYYYYCGTQAENVRAMLRSLGIGRNDPNQTH